MRKLFETKNIGLIEMVDEDGLDIYIAYTEDLLKKNLLIEFYEAEMEEEEIETAIFVLSVNELRSYTFTLRVTPSFMVPLEVLRIVSDAVDFIAKCDVKTVLGDIEEEIATGVIKSNELDKLDSKRVLKDDTWKFTTALELIKDNKPGKGL